MKKLYVQVPINLSVQILYSVPCYYTDIDITQPGSHLFLPWNFTKELWSFFFLVKPALSGHSKIDKTKILKTNGSLMKVESIAECSLGAFCNTFDLH